MSIIVLNWNGAGDTIDCVGSLFAIAYRNYEVTIVDNGSTDHSDERIERYLREGIQSLHDSKDPGAINGPGAEIGVISEAAASAAGNAVSSKVPFGTRIVMIRNHRNLGFAAGNNVGAAFALRAYQPDYVLLLNNDTIVEPAFLAKLVSSMETDPGLGVLAPRLVDGEHLGSVPAAPCPVGRVHWMRYPGYSYGPPRGQGSDPSGKGIVECDWVSGAAMLIRTKCLEHGLLNTDYFFGGEDVELCISLKRSGWRVGCRPDAIVWHKGGAARRKKYPTRILFLMSGVLGALRFVRNNRRDYLLLWNIYAVTVACLVLKLKLEDWFHVRIDIAGTLQGLQ